MTNVTDPVTEYKVVCHQPGNCVAKPTIAQTITRPEARIPEPACATAQRKLDELLRSSKDADSSLIAVEEAPDDALANLARFHVAEREHARNAG